MGQRPGPAAGAWAPGLGSTIPVELRPLITLFRPEHAFVDHAEARELAGFCGFDELELVALRPERLVVHELLVRVTADLSVPDGPGYETLGLNLRAMVATLHERHLAAEMPRIVEAFEAERAAARELVARELAEHAFAAPPAAPTPVRTLLERLFGRRATAVEPAAAAPPERRARERWSGRLEAGVESALDAACLRALIEVTDAIVAHRGRLPADAELVTRLAVDRALAERGSDVVARLVEPVFLRAVEAEGYRLLPAQREPVILNVKGASAAGKSTVRPEQREFTERLGIAWEDFALISPDYWRKYLLDYESLGEHYRYGAMLTGNELAIVDAKLDRHMARKAADGRMSHLLIDRFRFDSFVLVDGRTVDSGLLSRFGRRVFMFFMITPPAETVERAWKRGLSTGRYKAVDDLLYHNVEAFTGMPALFLSWVRATDKEVHFEFLDNDVPEGEPPRTAAFGRNGSMTVLDVDKMIDVDRYRKVNVDATTPEEVFDGSDRSAGANLEFLVRCAREIDDLKLARGDEPRVYAHVVGGTLRWWDREWLSTLAEDDARRLALDALGDTDGTHAADAAEPVLDVSCERGFTLGRWP